MQWHKLCMTALGLVGLAGCVTTQEGAAAPPSAQGDHQPIYVDYHLPERQFQIEVTYQLRKCLLKKGGKVEFEAKIGATVSPVVIPSKQSFRFDPTLLPNTRVAQNVSISLYPNGTIKSLNATSEDKTGSIVGGIFKFVGGFVKSIFTASADMQALAKEQKATLCQKTVENDAKKKKKAKKDAEKKAGDWLVVAEKLEKQLGQRKKELSDTLKLKPSGDRSKIIAAYQKAIDGLKEELASIRASKLTIIKKYTFGPTDLARHQSLNLTKDELEKWLTPNGYALLLDEATNEWHKNNWGQKPKQPVLHLDFHLKGKAPKDGAPEVAIDSGLTASHDRIFIRRPMQTTFEVCMWTCVDRNGKPAKTKRYASGPTTVPQWSPAQPISFDVAMFQKRVLKMSFAEDGRVTDLSWEVPARANAVVTGLAGISEGAATFIDTVRYARVNAEIKDLETETKLYKDRVALKDAKKAFLKAFSTDEDSATTSSDTSAP